MHIDWIKKKGLRFVFFSIFLFTTLVLSSKTQGSETVTSQSLILVNEDSYLALPSVQQNSLRPNAEHQFTKTSQRITVIVTGYSSTPWQTDSTPFITAAGTKVKEGIVATNFLPFGTKIRIPEIYGDKIFVVEDRMHPRNNYFVDIWFPSYWQAKNFGVRKTVIEILEG